MLADVNFTFLFLICTWHCHMFAYDQRMLTARSGYIRTAQDGVLDFRWKHSTSAKVKATYDVMCSWRGVLFSRGRFEPFELTSLDYKTNALKKLDGVFVNNLIKHYRLSVLSYSNLKHQNSYFYPQISGFNLSAFELTVTVKLGVVIVVMFQ